MHGIRHPFTGALHERAEDGNVLVSDGERQGLFRPDGSWVSGELRVCDPQLCGWVAGPLLTRYPLATDEPTP